MQWEARLVRDAFYNNQHALSRFLPVVLPGQSVDGVPDFLGPHICTVYTVTDFTVAGAEPLLRLLTRQPEETEPPLGTPPVLRARAPAALAEVESLVNDGAQVETEAVAVFSS